MNNKKVTCFSRITAFVFKKTAHILNTFACYSKNTKTINKQELARWFADKGDQTHRLFYEDINRDSLVFDVGGYKGQWSSDIYSMYRCCIHIFEPITFFVDEIEKRFAKNPDVFVHKFGLSDKNQILKINVEGSEYDLLENLFENGLIEKINNVQVQFHSFVKNSDKRMAVIQKRLSSTHELT